MVKNQNTLAKNGRKEQFTRIALATLVMALFTAFAATPAMMTAFAAGGALGNVMNIVMNIVGDAAKYIGAVIVIWGVFQIVLAFRREDSEGISKQITTVVVGGVLVGFGALLPQIRAAIGV